MSEDFDINFEEVTGYDSDAESITSDIYEDHSLDDWIVNINKFSDFENIHYTLGSNDTDVYENTNEFVNSIISANNNLRKSITSLRLLADIHNPDDPSDIRYSQNIRFEIEDLKIVKN